MTHTAPWTGYIALRSSDSKKKISLRAGWSILQKWIFCCIGHKYSNKKIENLVKGAK